MGKARKAASRSSAVSTHQSYAVKLIEEMGDLFHFSEQHRKVARAQYRALRAYTPQVYPDRLTLFRSRMQPLFSSHKPDKGWGPLAGGGLEIRSIPGNHLGMLQEPHVKALAKELRACSGQGKQKLTDRVRRSCHFPTSICPASLASTKQFVPMNRPLRFCVITTFYPLYSFGGDGIYVNRLCNELARRGHHVEMIHCVDAYRLLARHESENSYEDHPNVTVHGLKSPVGFLPPALNRPAIRFSNRPASNRFWKRALMSSIITTFADRWSKDPGVRTGIKLYTMHEYCCLLLEENPCKSLKLLGK